MRRMLHRCPAGRGVFTRAGHVSGTGPDLLNPAEQPPRQGLSWGLLSCVRRYGPGRISIGSGPGFEHPEIRLPEPGPGYGLEQFQFVRELHGILALGPVGDSAFMPGKAVAKGQ